MLTQLRGANSPFDTALRTERCVLELTDGTQISLPVARWHAAADTADELLLDRCTGPTLDIGCGPGRLTIALGRRAVPVLGVDVSPVAVRLTKRGGGVALQRDVFGRMPGVGRWQHVLLADGNVGIGGDPLALLRRVATLLDVGGTALVEVAAPGTGLLRIPVRLADEGESWFPWAVLDAQAAVGIGRKAGLVPSWHGDHADRWFVELTKC
ncbi:MAG TPA: class I SAM-dependent methyltransferase [Pseudonocardiaceae bacterium]